MTSPIFFIVHFNMHKKVFYEKPFRSPTHEKLKKVMRAFKNYFWVYR